MTQNAKMCSVGRSNEKKYQVDGNVDETSMQIQKAMHTLGSKFGSERCHKSLICY